MALAIKKLPVKAAAPALVPSKIVQVFDVPIELLIESKENPNEQDEATFDQMVEEIKTEGFDEPVKVIPVTEGEHAGKYIIYSGHHRVKVCKVLKWKAVPCVIKEGWTEDKRKIELVRQNMLKGKMNSAKFTTLYNELAKKYDPSVLKLQMGFTKEDAFKQVYKNIEKSLTPDQKKKLEDAKETITSIDGLSSVLNNIFKEHGADLDHGFIVFNFGGKSHHYVECDKQLHQMMEKFEGELRKRNLVAMDVFKQMVTSVDLSKFKPSGKVEQRKELRLSKK